MVKYLKSFVLFIAIVIIFLVGCQQDITSDAIFEDRGGSGGPGTITFNYDEMLPSNIGKPSKVDYVFSGYWDSTDWTRQYFDSNMNGVRKWDKKNTTKLYARWIHKNIANLNYLDMVDISGGTFLQTDGLSSFTNTLSSYKIAKYEVTYELWHQVRIWAEGYGGFLLEYSGQEGNDGNAGNDPTSAKYEPVTYIEWQDAIVWCNAYSIMSDLTPCYTNNGFVLKDSSADGDFANPICNWNANGFRLPTESEWQYAASDRGITPFNHISGDKSNSYNLSTIFGDYAWYSENSSSLTHDVGTKKSNLLGIFDMSGNVREYCWDRYGDYPGSNQINYRGPTDTGINTRSIRGGAFSGTKLVLQVGIRNSTNTNLKQTTDGFRVARSK